MPISAASFRYGERAARIVPSPSLPNSRTCLCATSTWANVGSILISLGVIAFAFRYKQLLDVGRRKLPPRTIHAIIAGSSLHNAAEMGGHVFSLRCAFMTAHKPGRAIGAEFNPLTDPYAPSSVLAGLHCQLSTTDPPNVSLINVVGVIV